MADFENSSSIILKNVRLDYSDLFVAAKPQLAKDEANPKKWKFKAKAIFAPGTEAFEAAKKGLMEAATKLWGANAGTVVPSIASNSKAVRNGNDNLMKDGSINPEYAGKFFISASNVSRPQVVAQRRHPTIVDPQTKQPAFIMINADGSCSCLGQLIDPPFPITVPYRGCYVNL